MYLFRNITFDAVVWMELLKCKHFDVADQMHAILCSSVNAVV